MKQSRGWAALAAALIAFAPLHAVRADEQTDEVKSHLAKAKVHYDLGEFDDAAEEYIQAYRIKPIPGALYNIAQAYRQAGKYDKSRQFYRSYLREANPEGKIKATVEKQLKELDELVAKEEKARRSSPTGVQASTADDLAPPPTKSDPSIAKLAKQVPAPAPSPAPAPDLAPPPTKPAQPQASATPPLAPIPAKPAPQATPAAKPPPSVAIAEPAPKSNARPPAPPVATQDARVETRVEKSHTLSYVIGAAGLAVLGGGVFFGVQAARADNELTAGAHSRADADTLINTSKTDHLVSAVMLGVGAAAIVGAGVLYFLPASGPSGGQGVAVAGTF